MFPFASPRHCREELGSSSGGSSSESYATAEALAMTAAEATVMAVDLEVLDATASLAVDFSGATKAAGFLSLVVEDVSAATVAALSGSDKVRSATTS